MFNTLCANIFSLSSASPWYASPLDIGTSYSIKIHMWYSWVHKACRAPIGMVNTRSHHRSMLRTCGLSSKKSYLKGSMSDRSCMIWVCPNLRSTRRGAYGWTPFKPISLMKYRSSPLTMTLGVDNQWSFHWIPWLSSSVRNICQSTNPTGAAKRANLLGWLSILLPWPR